MTVSVSSTSTDVLPPVCDPTVGQYGLSARLGRGTYGEVFSAVDKVTNEKFAVKQIQYKVAQEYLFLFFREVSILKSLHFFSILTIHDILCPADRDCVWLVTPLMDSDLRAFVKATYPERRVPVDALRSIMYQIVAGVSYCHSLHVLHRDLKPQNVLIDKNTMRIRIADFGLAKSVVNRLCTRNAEVAQTHDIVTLWYRAPEVILGASHYGAEIDVWSLGVILLELYSGKTPFDGQSEVDTLIKVFSLVGTPTVDNCPKCNQWANYSGRFPKWSSTDALSRIVEKDGSAPPFLPVLVEQALRINPDSRITAEDFLSHAWFRGLSPSDFPV